MTAFWRHREAGLLRLFQMEIWSKTLPPPRTHAGQAVCGMCVIAGLPGAHRPALAETSERERAADLAARDEGRILTHDQFRLVRDISDPPDGRRWPKG